MKKKNLKKNFQKKKIFEKYFLNSLSPGSEEMANIFEKYFEK